MPLGAVVVTGDRSVLVLRKDLEDPLWLDPLGLVLLLVLQEVELGVREALLGHRGPKDA
jgi:hypothetical protein